MNHIDTYSGAGGFALAASWMGWHTVQFVEKDPFCQSVLKARFPGVPIHDDITTFRSEKFRGHADIFTAGFPCQPYSVAGRREGDQDDRFLWPQTLDAFTRSGCGIGVFENVTGILSLVESDCVSEVESKEIQLFSEDDNYQVNEHIERVHRRIIGRIINDLKENGYALPTYSDGRPIVLCLPACAVGAPHRRDRIWIVAYERESFTYAGGNGFGDLNVDGQNRRETDESQIDQKERKRLRGKSRRERPAVGNAESMRRSEIERIEPDGDNGSSERVDTESASSGLERPSQRKVASPGKGKRSRDRVSEQSDRTAADAEIIDSGAGLRETGSLDNRPESANGGRSAKDTAIERGRGRDHGDPARNDRTLQIEGSDRSLYETGDAEITESIGRKQKRSEPKRSNRSKSERPGGNDPNASIERLPDSELERSSGKGSRTSRSITERAGDDPDTDSGRSKRLGRKRQKGTVEPYFEYGIPSWGVGWLDAATEFCGVDDGLPDWLDVSERKTIYKAVERFGIDQVSRAVGFDCSKVENLVQRRPRLTAMGNAIVPQVAFMIFVAIVQCFVRKTKKVDV